MLRHCIIRSRLINRSINQSINQLKRPSRCFSVNSNPSSTGQSTNQSTNLPGHQSPNQPINQASNDRTNQSTNQSTNRLAIALVVGASIIAFGIYQSKVHAQKDQSINQPPAETLNKPASTTPSIIGSTNQSTNQSTDQSKDVSFRVPGLDVLHAAVSLLLTNPSTSPPPIHEFPPSTNQSTDLPPLKYPVVLVHGFLGYSSLLTNPLSQRPMFEYFGEVRQMFEDAGYTVLVPILPKSYKIEHRAKALQVALGLVDAVVDTTSTSWDGSQVTQRVTPVQPGDQRDVVEAKEGAKKLPQPTDQSTESSSIHVLSNSKIDLTTYKGPFHLISHSMGGVDGRYLISHLQPDDETENRILSLTTIGSPHRGSPIADLIVEQVQKNRNLPVFQYSNGIISTPSSSTSNQDNEDAIKLEHIVALIEKVFNIEFKGMLDLTTNAAKEFNKQTLDRPGTRYYSYAGWRKFDPWSVWFVPSKVIDAKEGYNDGLVSVHSARWGDFKGVVGMDHLEQVGLGVFHDHLPLFKEIAGTLAEVERQHGAEQDNLTAMREKKGKKSARESADLDRKEKRAGERQERQRHEEEERVRK